MRFGVGSGQPFGLLQVASQLGETASEFFAGVGGDDFDVAVVDQHDDGCAGVAASDADVVEAPVVAEGEFAVAVDNVVADPEVVAR